VVVRSLGHRRLVSGGIAVAFARSELETGGRMRPAVSQLISQFGATLLVTDSFAAHEWLFLEMLQVPGGNIAKNISVSQFDDP
jgi:hypothetical protein